MRHRVCVDFDGVIFDGTGIVSGCVEALAQLRHSYNVAIFSARATDAERQQMVEILTAHQVPFDEILPPKPECLAFIDDKAIRFEGWDKIALLRRDD